MSTARLWLTSCASTLLLSACAQKIPNIRACGVAALLADGADCAATLQNDTWSLTLGQVIELIEPQPERECVPVPGMNLCDPDGEGEKVRLPARGGALLIPPEDFMKIKIFIEQTCRRIRCSAEVVDAVERVSRVSSGRRM